MLTRRDFVQQTAAAAATTLATTARPGTAVESDRAAPRTMAIVSTEWRLRSHSQHMGDRFLHGYPTNGRWNQPRLPVVALYADQVPKNDLSRPRSKEFGFTIYPTVAETLRRGGERLAVDAVLLIGEHGNYPRNELGQKQYPRYELFKKITDVFREDGRSVPVFNDKHLSWKWQWAQEMVEISRELDFPFMAGSSLPVTWRMPAIEMPRGAEVEELVGVAYGGVDSYDFHILEVMQCMAERRQGGETGVTWVQGLRGAAFWKAWSAGSWERGGLEPRAVRSLPLPQPDAGPAQADLHPSPSDGRRNPNDGQGPGRLPLPTPRRHPSDNVPDEWVGGRLYLCRDANRARRTPLDAVSLATRAQRPVLGRTDGARRGDVHHRPGAVPRGADAADVGRTGRVDRVDGQGQNAPYSPSGRTVPVDRALDVCPWLISPPQQRERKTDER